MACNFSIANNIRLMILYEIYIFTILEQTPWKKELSQMEMASIERTCDKWGFMITISKL
jgi:hypothetical protein